MKKYHIDRTLDVRGYVCPAPTVMTGKALKEMKKGTILQVITNDVTTRDTIPSLCTQEGYALQESREENGLIYYIVSV